MANIAIRPIGGGNLSPGTTETRLAPASTIIPIGADPNPRTISTNISGFNNLGDTLDDPQGRSDWTYVFGQFVDHDLDKEALNAATNRDVTVPAGDPNFPAGTIIPLGGSAGPNAVNTVAGYLDLSQVYGSDATTAASLRNADGTLKTSAGNNAPIVNGQFVSGDVRVGEQPELTGVTTMFIREHNRIVVALHAQNPGMSGDKLYDQARAITTAEYQNIVINEFLPALIGTNLGAYPGFNPNVSANVSMEFATAAFRVGHSQISDGQNRIGVAGDVISQQTLGQAFLDTPAQAAGPDNFSALMRSLGTEAQAATDPFAIADLRNVLLAPPQAIDLMAIDIQRERDLSLPTLNETRSALGMAPYTSFGQLSSDPTIQTLYAANYADINHVDLFMGGLAEDHTAGSVGPTFGAIIADQFSRLRIGDQFWWQNQGFNPNETQTIGQTRLADIIEQNTGTPVFQHNLFAAVERHLSNVAPEDPSAAQLVIGVDDAGATIAGGPADDTIVPGLGTNQLLTGGGGRDTFVFVAGAAHTDTITDFTVADLIRFDQPPSTRPFGSNDVLHVTAKDVAGSAVVSDGLNTVSLQGFAAGSLSAPNFFADPGTNIQFNVSGGH